MKHFRGYAYGGGKVQNCGFMECMNIWFGESYISIVPFFVGFGSRPFGRRPVRSWPFCFELFFASADLAPSLRVLARGLAFEGSNFHIQKQR